jgi:hypothetical protein
MLQVPKMRVVALRFTETARARIVKVRVVLGWCGQHWSGGGGCRPQHHPRVLSGRQASRVSQSQQQVAAEADTALQQERHLRTTHGCRLGVRP